MPMRSSPGNVTGAAGTFIVGLATGFFADFFFAADFAAGFLAAFFATTFFLALVFLTAGFFALTRDLAFFDFFDFFFAAIEIPSSQNNKDGSIHPCVNRRPVRFYRNETLHGV